MDIPDPLDDLLSRSAPPISVLTPELRDELRRMATDGDNARRPAFRRPGVAVGSAIAVALLMAGTATAAATGVIDWGPWATDPDVVYTYTLPNDEPCELRVAFDDRSTGNIARDIVAVTDLSEQIDVEGWIVTLRAMPATAGDEYGNTWDAGYGTEFYPGIDEEYDRAVGFAVTGFLTEELNARGVAPEAQDAIYGSTCSIQFSQ